MTQAICATVFFVVTFVQAPVFAQFDYRDANVIKANGDTLIGKVVYRNSYLNRSSILFKDKNGKHRIDVSELRRLGFADHGTYQFTGLTPDSSALIQVIMDGDVVIYSSRKIYYLFKDSLYFLDNHPVRIVRNGKPVRARSKKYLSALYLAFRDCAHTLEFKPLANSLKLRPLIKLTNEYTRCRNLKVRNMYPKATIEVVPYAGIQKYSMSSDRFANVLSQSGDGRSIGVSLLKSFRDVRDLNVRVDFIYLDGSITQYYEEKVINSPITAVERRKVVFDLSGLHIPIGLQYYVKRNDFGVYFAGGFQLSIFDTRVFNAEGTYLFQYDGATVYQQAPVATFAFDTKLKPFSQAWLSFGGDYKLSGRLRINAEIKALQSNYSLMEDKHGMDGRRVQSFSTMKVTTMSPQFGLKFKLQ